MTISGAPDLVRKGMVERGNGGEKKLLGIHFPG